MSRGRSEYPVSSEARVLARMTKSCSGTQIALKIESMFERWYRTS